MSEVPTAEILREFFDELNDKHERANQLWQLRNGRPIEGQLPQCDSMDEFVSELNEVLKAFLAMQRCGIVPEGCDRGWKKLFKPRWDVTLKEFTLKAASIMQAFRSLNATESDDDANEFEYQGWMISVLWWGDTRLYGLLFTFPETGESWEIKAEDLPPDASFDGDEMLAWAKRIIDHPEEFNKKSPDFF